MNDGLTSEQRIEHGLESIDPGRKVEVPLRDLMYVHQTLSEFVGFLHQPENYPTVESLNRFLGSVDRGAYRALHRSLYEVMPKLLPQDIEGRIEDFDPGGSPNYDNGEPPNRLAGTDPIGQPRLPHHPACGSAPGGSDQTRALGP